MFATIVILSEVLSSNANEIVEFIGFKIVNALMHATCDS
jgi:hypothetical protein